MVAQCAVSTRHALWRHIRRVVVLELLMVRKSVRQQQALRRARERHRVQDDAETMSPDEIRRLEAMPIRTPTETDRRRLLASTCGWCNGPYRVRGSRPDFQVVLRRVPAHLRTHVVVVERRVEDQVQEGLVADRALPRRRPSRHPPCRLRQRCSPVIPQRRSTTGGFARPSLRNGRLPRTSRLASTGRSSSTR